MNPPPTWKFLTKIDRRKQWKDLKSKHSQAIAAAKLDFDQKLGPALDKYQAQVEKLTKLAAATELNSLQIEPVRLTVVPLKKIVLSYHDKVKTLPDPAKKELTGLLTAIGADCQGWEELASNTMSRRSSEPPAPTAAQKAAAGALIVRLASIHTEWMNLLSRGPGAKASYEAGDKSKLAAAAILSNLMEKGRTVGPDVHELSMLAQQASKGSNYELFKGRAKTAAGLIQSFRDAAHEFHAAWRVPSDDSPMTMTDNLDAKAVYTYCKELIPYCDGVLADINKLP